ncbi:MAG: type I DNA topoisomerase, partial [Myxococcales bacterium]|nr:type I DNA topoisomerase [Myxococcales bacterium]
AAIKTAIDNPRELDRALVDAQEARRILDRLYGYDVSPVLWRKVGSGLSAGRVQSVATRVIVEREKQRIAFVKAGFWGIDCGFQAQSMQFSASVVAARGSRIATSKDFDDKGQVTKPNLLVLDEAKAWKLATELDGTTLKVQSVERKPNKRSPAAPFMTSTLQQEASRKLRFGAQRAMRSAQRLYEGGYITYMRTDSTQLSTAAIESARSLIKEMYGADYLPSEPRIYAKKVKNAQEAHEAIRPAGDSFRHPDEVAKEVGIDEGKLYELIWKRTIASQMKDSIGESVQVKIGGKSKAGDDVELSASGHSIVFPGFLRAYVEGSDDPAAELESRERHLPRLEEGQSLVVESVDPRAHETQPPARYTEASLVQKLEELGVGRPSTYASTIHTITGRGYIWKKGAALVPSFLAFAVIELLEKHFDVLVDYAFTAKMEDDLDAIAGGESASGPWLERFYFGEDGVQGAKSGKAAVKASGKPKGDTAIGLKQLVESRMNEIDARQINTLSLGKDAEGREINVRVGKYGPYLERGEDRASIPNETAPDELTIEHATELLARGNGDRVIGNDPETGKPIYVKAGRFGPYFQLGDVEEAPAKDEPAAKGKKAKKEKAKKEKPKAEGPKRASLLKSWKPDTVTLEDALLALSLPRTVGTHPTLGEDGGPTPILARIGQYGPYVTAGKETRSLTSEEQVFSITQQEAMDILAQPKTRQRRAPAEPLKTFPEDTVSKKPIVVREGKFGLYVTDGETNATLRRDDTLENLTHERAQELLQDRRDRGDTGGKKGKRPAPKKAAAKAEAAPPAEKKPAKKPAPKKPAAKKPAAKSKKSSA